MHTTTKIPTPQELVAIQSQFAALPNISDAKVSVSVVTTIDVSYKLEGTLEFEKCEPIYALHQKLYDEFPEVAFDFLMRH